MSQRLPKIGCERLGIELAKMKRESIYHLAQRGKMRKLSLMIALLSIGCANTILHPGTANQFDSAVFDTLSTADNVIDTTRTDLAAGKFPASISPSVKSALNGLITAYNLADTFYCGAPIGTSCQPSSYHSLVNAGNATPAQTQQMSQLQANVNSATTNLSAATGGK